MKAVNRWFKITAGVVFLILGLILMPVPGFGGTPVTLAGLALLASELPFAGRLREKFLALRTRYYSNASPAQRFAIVAGLILFYISR